MREEGLDFRREDQLTARSRVKERPHAEPIAGQEEGSRPGVPDAKRPLSVERVDGIDSLFFVEMKQHFGVGPGAKAMTLPNEILAKLEVVEDLTIERDPERAVLVRHRLLSARDVENAEPGMGEPRMRLDVDTAVVGAAMAQQRDHIGEAASVDLTPMGGDDSGNPTHRSDES